MTGDAMTVNAQSYLSAAYPPPLQPPHLSDEDIAEMLDRSEKRSRAARKASETCKQKKRKAQQHA